VSEDDVALSCGFFDDRETEVLKAGARYQIGLRLSGAALFDVGSPARLQN
jgi:hypothetical protein